MVKEDVVLGMIDLLRSDNLNLPYDSEADGIVSLLKKKYSVYKDEFCKFVTNNSNESMKKVKDNIEMSTNGIINAINKYLLGDITGACSIFNDVVANIAPSIKAISEYYGDYVFRTYYRARIHIEGKNLLNSKEEFLHIPFELRHLVQNQRYSVSGFPCMYLGGTPYTCYEEVGRPKPEEMYFSRIEIPKEYKLITIGLLPYELRENLLKQGDINNDKVITDYLKMLPIIMACSVKVSVNRKNGAFKEEYIIPQLFMQWLITSGRDFDGILYFSTATQTRSKINYRLYQNVVLPVKDIKSKGYCEKLSNDIKLTFPVSAKGVDFFKEYDAEAFRKYDYKDNLPVNGRIRKDDNSKIHYSASGFRLIEYMLGEKKCERIEG